VYIFTIIAQTSNSQYLLGWAVTVNSSVQTRTSAAGVSGDDQLNTARFVAYHDKRSDISSPFHIDVQYRITHSQMGGTLKSHIGSNKAPCCKGDAKDVTTTTF
jgi:hypothetical protein